MDPLSVISGIVALISVYKLGFVLGRKDGRSADQIASQERVVADLRSVLGRITIKDLVCIPPILKSTQQVKVAYQIENQNAFSMECWLGLSILDGENREHWDASQDKALVIFGGTREYQRYLTVPENISPGKVRVIGQIWLGETSNPTRSLVIARFERDNVTLTY
jgi:hypothetical protein